MKEDDSMKHGARKHLEESIPLVKEKIYALEEQIEEMKPDIDIVTIGEFVKKQIELIELEEKLVRMLEELGQGE